MNLKYLNEKIKESRISITAFAEWLGISRQSFYQKINGKYEFKSSEVATLCRILRLSEDEKQEIFFADAVDKTANQKGN